MDITSYILSKKYVEDSLQGMGALKGLSAYEVAQKNGFTGSEKTWLESLRGPAPYIGETGNWCIEGVDTGVLASPSLHGYATEAFVQAEITKAITAIEFPKVDLSNYATKDMIPSLNGYVTEILLNEKFDIIDEIILANTKMYSLFQNILDRLTALEAGGGGEVVPPPTETKYLPQVGLGQVGYATLEYSTVDETETRKIPKLDMAQVGYAILGYNINE